MKKKFLALVLTLAMVLSLVPVTALATNGLPTPDNDTADATQPRTSVTADSGDGVHISKKVVQDGDNYNLVMEAYVEGITETTNSTKPLDIVLVLDVSGSMNDKMGNRDKTKRIDALKTAVNAFIDNVAQKNKDTKGNTVGHRISIVKFAGNQSTEIGDDTYTERGILYSYTYNYSQIVKNLTAVNDAGKVALKTAVNALQPAGATRADYGMELAKKELANNSKDQSRDKVVVMFTDGTPTSGEDFESSVASGAISASKALKDKDVKVYTIGIFSGANPQAKLNKTSQENKYMHAVSSNYPDAALTSTQTGFLGSTEWHWNFGTRAQDDYYLSAKNSTELNNVFQTISDSITTTDVTAGTSAVLRDTLTKQFVLNGDVNDITVQTAAVTGKGTDGYTWEDPVEVTTGIEKNVSSDGKTVTVKGFNYTSTGTTGNVITKNGNDYSGHKLIVTIPIKVNEAYEGWKAGTKNYDTNTTGDNNKAGLTGYTKDGQEASTLLNESPQIPVAAYTVTYQYSDNHEEAPPLTNYSDGKAYLPEKSITIKDAPTWTGYTFSGWKLPEGLTAGEDGSFSMPAWDVKITGSWTENQVTIHYVALDGGTITESTETDQKNYSETVGLAHQNVKGATAQPDTGMYFVGWYSDRECNNFVGGQTKLVPTIESQQGDVTYYAKFSNKQTITIQVPNETLTYTGRELTGKGYSDAETTGLQAGYIINVTQDNYRPATGTNVSSSEEPYTGSFANPQFTILQGGTNVTDQFDVIFIPGKLHIKGNVTYDPNANDATVTGLPQDTDTYFLNADVPVKDGTPEREGYTFEGWTLSKEDQTKTVTQGTMGATGLTFYAKWSEKKVDVKLSDLIKKELTVKKDSTLPDNTQFTVTVTPTGDQPAITGTTTNKWEGGTTDTTTGDTTYTVPFDFKTKNTLSLPAGTYTYTVQETKGDVSGMQYDSEKYTLTITIPESGEAPYQANSIIIKNTYQTPDLTIEKKPYKVNDTLFDADKTVAHVNDQIIWTVSVTNTKTTQASTQLTETLTGAAVYSKEEFTDANKVSDANGTWTATVSGGKTKTYYVTYKVQATDIPNGKIVNTIVKGDDKDHPINSDPVSTWDTKQLKSAKKLDTSDWTTTVTLELPTVSKTEQQPATQEREEVKPDPIAVKSGSYVIDQIGNEFTFMDGLSLKVGAETYTGVKDESANTYTFATKDGKTYPDTVTYTAKNGDTPAQFTWNINEDVYAGTEVTLSYKLKLTTPKTAAGTYGVEDLNGSGQIEQAKALYTNESAILYKKEENTKLAEFPKPSVSYTIKGSSGGHGGNGGGTVTIPDDVPTGLNGKDHYAYVVGYPDGMVYPQKNITRAEVATIFFRLLKDETREANMTKSNSYNDMKDGAWYTCAVSTLSKMGIIKGYEDGSFKPDASISRAEFAAIAARFDPDGDKTPATFSDVSSHWAKDEISIAANHGWIKGYEDGSFKPDQKITRAETMTLVNRVLKRLPETKDDLHKDMKTWPDNQNESAWFYLAVQEATNSHYQKLKKDGTHETWESMRETRDWAALEK